MTAERVKRVAVIGAGASGLPSIRHAVLYGFDVVCFEAQHDIGGLWRYKPEETDESSVMKSTVINSSKELTAYSDFPPPSDEANYMHNTHMCGYLRAYADHFGLHKYIRLNTKVLKIARTADHIKTGQWKVVIMDSGSGEHSEEIFDGVLVCTGHHTKPYWPKPWPDQDKFKGQLLHAHSYKDHRGFEDQTVVVVGVGNSGGDVAVELSRMSKQVYLVSRRGTWVFNRIFDYGVPIDCQLNTRLMETLRQQLPPAIINTVARAVLNRRFDHKAYGLEPKHEVFGAHPTVNDELPNRIASGTIRVKPNIAKFGEHSVTFEDGTTVENVDSVIVSTGYSIEFPIIEDGQLISVNENEVDFFEYMFPLECEKDSLAVIGLIQPYGSIMPISEMQARLFLAQLAGRTKLPSKKERRERAAQQRAEMNDRYVKSRRHTIQVDYIPYMDELAALLGCSPPSVASLLFTDPLLACHSLLSPYASYFYRLKGPHAWSGARQAILGINDRVVKATNAKMSGSLCSLHNVGFVVISLFVGVLLTLLTTVAGIFVF